MILIFSKRNFELTTEEVMDWLDKNGGDYCRINGEDYYNQFWLDQNGLSFQNLDASKINAIWNRRWSDDPTFLVNHEDDLSSFGLNNVSNLMYNLSSERSRISSLLQESLEHAHWTTTPRNVSVHKIKMLKKAKSVGLQIPNYIITSDKEKLLDFALKHKKIITKPISEVVSFYTENEDSSERAIVLSWILDKHEIENDINEKFHFTMFQEYIEKDFEIRIFALGEKLYPMAIFSQKDTQTSVDFRNYNQDTPNRTVPYRLPESIEERLREFMKKSELNIGSIDLIKGIDGGYYFLEVNPVGQFGMVSYPCNYFLERELANYLKYEDQIRN